MMTITAVSTMLHSKPVTISRSVIEFSAWISEPDSSDRVLVSRMYIRSGDVRLEPRITRDELIALSAAIDEHLANIETSEKLFAYLQANTTQEVQP